MSSLSPLVVLASGWKSQGLSGPICTLGELDTGGALGLAQVLRKEPCMIPRILIVDEAQDILNLYYDLLEDSECELELST